MAGLKGHEGCLAVCKDEKDLACIIIWLLSDDHISPVGGVLLHLSLCH